MRAHRAAVASERTAVPGSCANELSLDSWTGLTRLAQALWFDLTKPCIYSTAELVSSFASRERNVEQSSPSLARTYLLGKCGCPNLRAIRDARQAGPADANGAAQKPMGQDIYEARGV
jgi:hypothetical protein